MSEQVSWIFDVQLQLGCHAEWRALMAEMIRETRAEEPGTIGYEWSATADGSRWQIHETYADSAAAMVHSNAFGRKYAARFFKSVTPTRMVVYGSPSAEVRASLATLKPEYMETAAGFTR